MVGCNLRFLFPALPVAWDCQLAGLTQDSRQAGPGILFLAKQGSQEHGLAYFDDVARRGVAAVAAEPTEQWPEERITALAAQSGLPVFPVVGLGRKASALAGAFYGSPSAGLRMIGVTGTNGKTSITHAIARALGRVKKCAVIGTLGNGVPGQLENATHTTPDAVELQRLLARFKEEGFEAVAMEVSSHALDQGRVEWVMFDRAVFTNLTRDHLDYHGTMEQYGAAKARLFHLPGTVLGSAILNGDDPASVLMADACRPGTRRVVYGLGGLGDWAGRADCLVRAESVEATPVGLRLRVAMDGKTGIVQSRWLGRFNASNLLAVLSVLVEEGMAFEEALSALSEIPVVPGRMEAFGGGARPLAVVDYAHTPDALEQVLLALRDHCHQGKLHCVFGCGGDRDRGKRPLMGAIAERLADRVILTDDNPRSEDGGAIIEEIRAGMANRLWRPGAVRVERDRARAIASAIEQAEAGDIVAICGKGHETTQRIGDITRHFSDREEVARIMGEELAC